MKTLSFTLCSLLLSLTASCALNIDSTVDSTNPIPTITEAPVQSSPSATNILLPSTQVARTAAPDAFQSTSPENTTTAIKATPRPVPSFQAPGNPGDPVALLDNNLLVNPGAEKRTDGQASNWRNDHWGANKVEFALGKHLPFSGQFYLAVDLNEYESGDAKWTYEAQGLTSGRWYEYGDYYRSDGRSRVLRVCEDPDTGKQKFFNISQTHKSLNQWSPHSFRFYLSPNENCRTAIYHVLDRNGFLHTDHHYLKEITTLPISQGLVSISFDDIWLSAAKLGSEELLKRNWKGTFYITKNFASNSNKNYGKSEDIKRLIAQGHEIGSHSVSHDFMSRLTKENLLKEINDTHSYLKDLGATVHGIAYPFGDFSGEVEQEVNKVHSYARTSLFGLNDESTPVKRLKVFAITRETSTEEITNKINDAIKTSSWLILVFHDLGESVLDPLYTTSSNQYIEVLNYIQNTNLKVVPVIEGVNLLNSLKD